MHSNQYNIKFLLAYLNSSIFNWNFKKIGIDLGNKGYEWKKTYIENVPIPTLEKINTKQVKIISNLIDQIYSINARDTSESNEKLEMEINNILYEIFNFDLNEIDLIEASY